MGERVCVCVCTRVWLREAISLPSFTGITKIELVLSPVTDKITKIDLDKSAKMGFFYFYHKIKIILKNYNKFFKIGKIH